jgi:glycogen debranching enzyme
LLTEDLIRALEILSVTPAFLRGLVEKQIYIRRLKSNQDFAQMVTTFMLTTEAAISQKKISPAGYYTGIWCRDASYILTELAQIDKRAFVASWLEWIWKHQLRPGIKTVYGRGAPERRYRLGIADDAYLNKFSGSLPSSIQYNYDEIYGKSPDIDSTSLMISAACKFLLVENMPQGLTEQLMPRIRGAVASLEKRDVDDDSLLEQGPNEDWMDNMQRTGKVVYSQATWAIALNDWQALLNRVKMNKEADEVLQKYQKVVKQVEAKLWHEGDLSYRDEQDDSNQYEHLDGGHQPQPAVSNAIRLTQDVSLFLLLDGLDKQRVIGTLDAIKRQLWKELGVACAIPLAITGPHKLGQYQYQNGGFWPWTTSIEILARLRAGQLSDSKYLLEKSVLYSPFEWINPYTKQSGSYPFKTGIASVRTAAREFLKHQRL